METLVTYPTAFFSLFFCFFAIYWLIGAAAGFDQNFGFDFDADLDINNTSFIGNIFVTFGLSKVPLSIGLTLTSIFGTIFCAVVHTFILSIFFDFGENFNPYNLIYILVSSVVVFLVLIASMWCAGLISRRISKLFGDSIDLSFDYIGKKGTVKSSKIDQNYGDIYITDDGKEFSIRAFSDGTEDIKYGDTVVVVRFEESSNSYLVKKDLV